MADMKRMPLHRVQRETGDGTLTTWLPDFEGRLDALLAAYEAQKTASKDYNPDHLPIDFGGHLAGSIRVKSFPGTSAGNMETFVADIKKARGGFHKLGDRIDSLIGGAYAKLWYGDDLLAPVESSNLSFDGDSLKLGTEIEAAEHRWGEGDRSWELGTGSAYELSSVADSGSYQGFTASVQSEWGGGSVNIIADPLDAARKVYQLSASGHTWSGAATYFTRYFDGITPFDTFVLDIELAYRNTSRTENYLTVFDGQKSIQFRFSATGFTVGGQTYTHPDATDWTFYHRLTVSKLGSEAWQVLIDGEVVLTLPYGTLSGSSFSTAYVQFLASCPIGLGQLVRSPLYREIHITRHKIDARLNENVTVSGDNHILLDAGAQAGQLITRPVELDAPAVSKLLTMVAWAGLGETQLDIRIAAVEAGPWSAWYPLSSGLPVPAPVADPSKLWYQLRARLLRETDTTLSTGTGLGSVSYGAPKYRGSSEADGVVSFDYGPVYTPPANGEANYADYLAVGWTYSSTGGWAGAVVPVSGTLSQDGTRQSLRIAGSGFGIYGQTSVLTSPAFTLAGDVHYVYSRAYAGLGAQATTTAALIDADTGTVLVSQSVGSVGGYSTNTLPVDDTLIGREVKLRFTSYFPEYIGANFDFRLDRFWQDSTLYYRTAAHQPGGNRIVGVRWKQRVGEPGDLVTPDAFPVIKLRVAGEGVQALYVDPVVLPAQVSPAGTWTDVVYPLPFPQYGTHVQIEVEGLNRSSAVTRLDVSNLEVDWEDVTYTGTAELHTAALHYDKELHLPEGSVVFRFDSTSAAARWKRLDADHGFPVVAGDLKWERRVMGGQRDAYVLLDAFEVFAPTLVTSPAIDSTFPVVGFGADASVLFTTYLYNERDVDQVLSIPVSSPLGNTWELFRNRVSLGRSKATYTLILPAKRWSRVDLFWHRDALKVEELKTDFAWHAATGVTMSSQRNTAGGMTFGLRAADVEADLAAQAWTFIKDGQSPEISGRYIEVRVGFEANPNRDLSPLLTMLTQNYLVDPVRDFQLTLRSVGANLARTVFEVKVVQLADEHNLLNLYQDLFENSTDIAPASMNITRDALLPGIRQTDPGQPGVYLAKPFANRAYVPSYVLLVADDTGSVVYEVSRDGGITWTPAVPGEYTELTGNQGVSIVLRATLTGGAAVHRWALVL